MHSSLIEEDLKLADVGTKEVTDKYEPEVIMQTAISGLDLNSIVEAHGIKLSLEEYNEALTYAVLRLLVGKFNDQDGLNFIRETLEQAISDHRDLTVDY